MNDKNEVLIQVQDLKKAFGKLEVLRGISTEIKKGEVVVVIGPSGSGKSTFLRSLNLLEIPTGGTVLFEGTDITDPKTDIDVHRQKIGMVFQHFHLFPHKTILENIMLAPVTLKKMSKEEAEKKAKELLKNTNMKVAQISEKVGFANVSYFCRSFREYYGCSPESYRKGTGEDEEALSDH